jgi:hypothetical protein
LFYKYPTNEDDDVKLEKFFLWDRTSSVITTRISNEFSHLKEIFDRSMTPIDVSWMQELAKYVLKKVEENDPAQYWALLNSINE